MRLLFIAIFLSSCFTAGRLDEALIGAFQGRPWTTLKKSWGEPNHIMEQPDGTKIVTYIRPAIPPELLFKDKEALVKTPRSELPRRICRFNFIVTKSDLVKVVFWDGETSICRRQVFG